MVTKAGVKYFSKLVITPMGTGKFRLLLPLIYSNPYGCQYVVPRGFETDFASIPWFLHGIINKHGKYDVPAVLHDWLYSSGIASRAEADKIFMVTMKDAGVKEWKYRMMYIGVRMGGWLAYNKYRRRDKE